MNMDGQSCACSIESATLGETLDSRHGDMTMAQLGPRIVFCTLHAAAPALHEALTNILTNCQVWQSRESRMGAGDVLALIEKEAEAALKLAEGRA